MTHDFEPWIPPAAQPQSRWLEAEGGARLHYVQWPAEPGATAVLMAHGRRAHARWFDPLAMVLSPRYRCAALDLRAHGESQGGGEGGFEQYAADLARFAAEFSGGPAIFVAHSMAGRPAVFACARHGLKPDLLVLADTPMARLPRHFRPEPPMRNKRFDSREAALARFRLMPGETSANPELLEYVAGHSIRRNEDGSWSWKFDEEGTARPVGFRMPDFSEVPLESVPCPTLVIYGEHSVLVDAEDAQAIAARVQGGRAVAIPGAHHHLMLDRPAAFAQALLAFFATNGL